MTLRQLFWMVEGHGQAVWAMASQLCAVVHNAHCGEERDLKNPDFFNPYKNDDKKTDVIHVTDEAGVAAMRLVMTGK